MAIRKVETTQTSAGEGNPVLNQTMHILERLSGDPPLFAEGELVVTVAATDLAKLIDFCARHVSHLKHFEMNCLLQGEHGQEWKWEDVPEYANLTTQQEWLDEVNSKGFIDYDGSGHYVHQGKMLRTHTLYPSRAKDKPLVACFSHVAWFDR